MVAVAREEASAVAQTTTITTTALVVLEAAITTVPIRTQAAHSHVSTFVADSLIFKEQ